MKLETGHQVANFGTKRYVYPMIAPPTAPQLEQDKQEIDESFERAFDLLDQLAKDTESLKESEESRTARLDSALEEVESVISDLKSASRRREEETKRISDEVHGLKDLIPKAIEGQKESTDNRLKELNTELKSLKTLMGQRMNPPPASSPGPYTRPAAAGVSSPTSSTPSNVNAAASGEAAAGPKPASVTSGGGVESIASLQGRSGSPFNAGTPPGRAAIPAWQMAAANKSTNAANTTSGSGSQEASGPA